MFHKPIILSIANSRNVKAKIDEIAKALCNNAHSGLRNNTLSAGQIGLSIFLCNYLKLVNQIQYQNTANQFLGSTIKELTNSHHLHTFSSGISGICWGINYLRQNNLVSLGPNVLDFLNGFDQYIFDGSNRDFQENNYDFLHGGLGAGIYFFELLPDTFARQVIETIVDNLNRMAEKAGNDVAWGGYAFRLNAKDEMIFEYNLGLSHGIPSIIVFLSKCVEQNINPQLCNSLLEGSVKWLLKQQNPQEFNAMFPYAIRRDKESIRETRLAWCYGDLGIASALRQAGMATNNEEWKEKAIEIMLHAAKRRDLKENGVMDAGICHGTAGIAHIFNRFYQATGREEFKETAIYWIEETLKMATWEDGIAGFKSWQGEERGWQNNYGLLEGTAGIGLVLLAAISYIEPKWDRCLLLS